MSAPTVAVAALVAGTLLSWPARAMTPYTPEWYLYSINQVCQVWSNGISRCFPVALIGQAPNAMANQLQHLMPLPAPVPVPAPMLAQADTPAVPVPAPEPAASPAPADPAPAAAVAKPAPASPPPAPILSHFEFDSAKLSPPEREQLDQWWSSQAKPLRLTLTGHADRLGRAAYNQTLSARRAQTVKRYLTGKGARPNDIRVAARGEAVPVVDCSGPAKPEVKTCLAPNRRVEIAFE